MTLYCFSVLTCQVRPSLHALNIVQPFFDAGLNVLLSAILLHEDTAHDCMGAAIFLPPILDRSRNLASVRLDLVFVVLGTVPSHFTVIIEAYSESLLLLSGTSEMLFCLG